jgi:hypothetical protein
MISLHARVLAGLCREPGEIVGRERCDVGGLVYLVRFADGRVRKFGNAHVMLDAAPIVRLPFRPRLVVNNGELVS